MDDLLTEIAREGARRMLAEALRAEVDAFVAGFASWRVNWIRGSSLRDCLDLTPLFWWHASKVNSKASKTCATTSIGA